MHISIYYAHSSNMSDAWRHISARYKVWPAQEAFQDLEVMRYERSTLAYTIKNAISRKNFLLLIDIH